MERLSSSNYNSLTEAYSAVYDKNLRSTLNEEKQIKEFLECINELLEEGYDLSECNYDELYEHYIVEGKGAVLKAIGGRLLGAAKGAVKTAWQGTVKQTKQGPKFIPGAKQSTKEILAKGGKVAPWVAGAAAVDQALLGGELRRLTTGAAGETLKQTRQALQKVPTPGSPSTTPVPTARTSAQKPEEKPKNKPLKILGGKVVGYDHFDMFDAVKGYLIGEGYAENEEAAVVIMANMSEEWRQSIVETIAGASNQTPLAKAIGTGAGMLKSAIKTGTQALQKNIPSGGYSTRPGDGKPYRDGPLWDGPETQVKKPLPQKPQPKPQQAPMRDEPLW